MAFETLSPRLQLVANRSLAYCRQRYGGTGLKIEEGISDSILWRPSFLLKPSKFRIIAVEVEDVLYTHTLRGAAQDINHYDFPISVYQACSLDAYQSDPKHQNVSQLKSHGFGIITVDDDGNVAVQHGCVPLAQHISPGEFQRETSRLTGAIKVAFNSSYDVYLTNEGQGLQQAGQIVEGILESIWARAVKDGIVQAAAPKAPLAPRIDVLWAAHQFIPHRAALGGARAFVNDFRNVASHAPKTAKEAAEKIRKCRSGFLNAIDIAAKLRAVGNAFNYAVRVYIV